MDEPNSIEVSRLLGLWIHSDDEGEIGQLVFRTGEYPFKARRMPRETLTLAEGGYAELGSPGPVDRNLMASASWELDGDQLTISGTGALAGRFRVIALDEQKLVLQRKD